MKRAVIVIVAMAIIPLAGLLMAGRIIWQQGADRQEFKPLLERSEKVISRDLPVARSSGELTLFDFGEDIGSAEIYDIAVQGEQLWIGTGRGLLSFVPDHSVTQYRQYANAPFEWTRRLAVNQNHLAVDVLVAEANTGGEYAGVHLRDLATGQWQNLGSNVLDQIWLNGELWQRPIKGRQLVKWAAVINGWQKTQVELQSRLCSEAYMALVGDQIWIAQQGTIRFSGGRRGTSHVKARPCGVIQYIPATGAENFFDEEQGLNSGFGRDVVGDAQNIYVSHSIKHDRISTLDRVTGRWGSLRPFGTGNSLVLGEQYLWLASPSGSTPLVGIERATEKRVNIQGVPAEYYVRAMAISSSALWLGLSRHIWEGQQYRVESVLGRLGLVGF